MQTSSTEALSPWLTCRASAFLQLPPLAGRPVDITPGRRSTVRDDGKPAAIDRRSLARSVPAHLDPPRAWSRHWLQGASSASRVRFEALSQLPIFTSDEAMRGAILRELAEAALSAFRSLDGPAGTKMLTDEIEAAQRLVRTDAYPMSIGEIVSMYQEGDLVIDPEFQRLFRWEIGQKSKLIESLLLGIPLPSIFVFEKADGKWELIDGLQRISTILEFMGVLKRPTGDGLEPPSILEATKYLPSLHNTVWEKSGEIGHVPLNAQKELEKPQQLSIRRSRLGLEILKRPSDDLTKFDLFQRLNAGGTQANPQELRNCIVLMINGAYFRKIKAAANEHTFLKVAGVNEDQMEKQRHMELAVRFLVHTFIPYDGRLDVEEYIDEGIVRLAGDNQGELAARTIAETFGLLDEASGGDALRRFENGRHAGKVGLVALECIAVGIAKNLDAIKRLQKPVGFVKEKLQTFWQQQEAAGLTSPGLRGTSRIQRTVPFGDRWFRP
ncbi:DUF262 domain-containing protein [Phenylobacterium conjunctum]|uniref:DUF262 domain-containing protein n=1 Tax=Phenylobacterium conjunctum TaxID=1298959 RepID=A0ABW3T1G3_9CAUL